VRKASKIYLGASEKTVGELLPGLIAMVNIIKGVTYIQVKHN